MKLYYLHSLRILKTEGLRIACLVIGSVTISGIQVQAQPQRSPTVEDQFRQASDAMRQGDLDLAGAGFDAVVKAAPDFAEARLNLGLVREEQGRHEEAIASFQEALRIKPLLRGANLFLGIAEYRLNRLDEAALVLRKETTANPQDATAWMWLGVVELAREHAEDAADALDRAAKLAPQDVDILYHRGQAHLLVSRNSYERMFKQDSKSWRVHQVLAQTAAEAERYPDAIGEYLTAIRLAPTAPGLHEELGTAYLNSSKLQEAEEAFQSELRLDPYNVLARYKLGVLAMERGDGARAKELIERALKEKPDLEAADYNLGRAESMLGDDAAALEHFKRATQGTDPDSVRQAWYQLGGVYRRLHRMDEARQAMAVFQKLKDQEQDDLRRAKLRRAQQSSEGEARPASPPSP
jgi:tetratricopeptide (TPR) repeat protein